MEAWIQYLIALAVFPHGFIRFPVDEKLPVALITKLVRARVRKNGKAKRQ